MVIWEWGALGVDFQNYVDRMVLQQHFPYLLLPVSWNTSESEHLSHLWPLLSEPATFTHNHVHLHPFLAPWDRTPRVLNLMGRFRSANPWCRMNYLITERLDHLLPLNDLRLLSGTFWTPQEMTILLNTNTFSLYTFCPRFFRLLLTWKVNATGRKSKTVGY